jgi:hypothetical protein
MPVKVESTPMLAGSSSVGGKAIVARFNAACMSSVGGLLALREVEQRLAIASRLATCIHDPRDPSRVVHGLGAIIRMRMLMIAAGYEDGNDADRLRRNLMFKFAQAGVSPPEAGRNRHLRPMNSPPLAGGSEPLSEVGVPLTTLLYIALQGSIN